ncbi:DUF4258 domain-containing protein [Candidatus Micrarchaeota archaeon]|nr:DUF4258 domain-containing protein [Candidatus Micrarchaeota archaeon]
MNKKKVVYSNHAITRMYQRDITEADIERTIDQPDYSIKSTDGRKIASKVIGSKTVRAIYKEESETIIVVTVY